MPASITFDDRDLQLFLDVTPRQIGISTLRALKRATRSAHTDAARTGAKDTGLKVGNVRKLLRRREPNAKTLTGEVRGSLARIPLVFFGARGPEPSRGRGRTTAIIQGQRAAVPGAFIATMKTGHRGVFKRKGEDRLPIRELRGPSIGRVLIKHQGRILTRASNVFRKEFDRLLMRIVGRARGNA